MALLVLLALHRKLDEDSIPVPRPGLAVDDADSWESTDKDELAEFVQTGMGRMRVQERFFFQPQQIALDILCRRVAGSYKQRPAFATAGPRQV